MITHHYISFAYRTDLYSSSGIDRYMGLPRGLVVKTPCFQCKSMGLITGCELRNHMLWTARKKKKKPKYNGEKNTE